MLRYLRIKEDLNTRLEALVARGDYPDFNSLALTALENLVTAEEEFAAQGAAERSAPTATGSEAAPQRIGHSRTSFFAAGSGPWQNRFDLEEEWIVPLPPDDVEPGKLIPLEQWLFGQENRSFPAKVNARLLTNLVATRREPIELGEAAHEISVAATQVFSLLHEIDLKNGHQKDDLLSTGFPQPNSEKSASRYANQFVAYQNTQGRLTGMMIEWKLAGVKRAKNKAYLYPTQPGVDFSAIENPLLDGQPRDGGREKFSEEEIAWALQHISNNVPIEAFAFTTILRGIQSGAKSPDSLDDYVRAQATEKSGITKEFVSTQRTGAVSRMADLNLVMRIRDGIRIFYELTDRGNTWLQPHKHHPTT